MSPVAPPGLRFFPRPAQIALALLAAYSLAYALLFVGSRYPFEYLEGVLVDAARRIREGAPLYCDLGTVPCVLLPHPPVYVGIVAAIEEVLGPSIAVGRALSFASLLATLGLLYLLARRHLAAPRAAILAPALYLVFVEVGYFSALMRPEALALALELSAVLVVLSPPRPGASQLARTVAGALLLVLALFAKPNLLAGPAAITLVLARRDRRQLVAFLAAVGAAAAIVLVVGDRGSGGIFVKNHVVAHTARVYALAQFLRILWYGALPWLPLLGGAAALAAREVRRAVRARALDFPLAFFVVALVWCTFSGSLEGSAAYYYFELYAATGLLVATRIEALAAAAEGGFPAFLRGAIWLQLALSLVVNPLISVERYQSYLRLWKNAPAFLGQLAAAPGLILVEDPIVAAAAHRPLLAEIFMDTQLAMKGRWDERPMIDLLEQGGISRVVLRETRLGEASWLQHERLTPRMLAAITAHYSLSWSDGSWYVYAYHPASTAM